MTPMTSPREPGPLAGNRWPEEDDMRHAEGSAMPPAGMPVPAAVAAGRLHSESPGAGLPGAAEQLDRLGNHLVMAGLRLARLRARLERTEDRLMLIQARYDLDEAMAEVRRLALAARKGEGN